MPVEPEPATSPPTDASSWVDDHGDALFRYARARLGRRDLAEDLVQDAFLAALASLDRFRGGSSPRTWLLAILRRKIADHYRRGDGKPVDPGNQADSPSAHVETFDDDGRWLRPPRHWPAPDDALLTEECRGALDGCLDRLPPNLADPFLFRERDGLETPEVCQLLNLTPGNLRIRLHRARLLLRECLETKWPFGPADGR